MDQAQENRFGLDNFKPGKPKTNREHLEEELGDLVAMINIMVDAKLVDEKSIEAAAHAKVEKLNQWSTIYENTKTQKSHYLSTHKAQRQWVTSEKPQTASWRMEATMGLKL